MKTIAKLIEGFYWLLLFLCPVLISVIIAFGLFLWLELLLPCVLIIFMGFLAGIVFAEKIRKKYGASAFYGRLLGSGDEEKEGK